MGKWDNMLAILWLLRSRQSMTAGEMAEYLEISVRTIYRYIDALCASGVPIMAEAGHEGGYRLSNQFRDAPLFFSPTELKALVHASRFAASAGYPYEQDLMKAIEKIQTRLSEEQMDDLKRHTAGFDVLSAPNDPSLEPFLRQIEQSVADGKRLEILYNKGKERGEIKRKLDPYGLVYRDNYWYLVGFCHLRQELRTFRVDRINQLTICEDTFVRPQDFSARVFLEQQWFKEYRRDEGEKVTLKVAGDPYYIDRLCDHWYLRNAVENRAPGEAAFVVGRESFGNYMPKLLLSFGKNIRVLEPEELKKKVIEAGRELVAFHETTVIP